MKKNWWLISLVVVLALVWLAVLTWPDQQLHLVFCDVGQGDAILISRGRDQVLIDGGPDERVIQCLSDHLPFWDRQIELLVSSHPDSDHLTGLISVLERYQVQTAVLNNLAKDSQRFWRFREALLAEKAVIHYPQAGEKLKIAGLDLTVLWPDMSSHFGGVEVVASPPSRSDSSDSPARLAGRRAGEVLGAVYPGDFNEVSVVLRLDYGHFCAFLPGDISVLSDKILDRGSPCQVLKVPHHGSKNSTSQALLEQLQPDLAVISVGKNSFGHPSPETISRLDDANIRVLRTDQNGEIEIISDGQSWQLKKPN